MARVGAKIPYQYRIILFSVLLISWCTGIGVYIFQEWIRVETPIGLGLHPAQKITRNIHGAAAFAMMIIYGYILASHVPSSWRQNRQRIAGLFLIGMQFVLIISGYLVYYAAGEELLKVVKFTHLIVGVMFPTILIIHIIGAMVTKPKRRKKAA